MTRTQQWLVIYSIGPVQGFIAAARSSRDLAYGSWLLSELAKIAARIIAEREGFEALIFPAPKSEKDLKRDSDLSVANKVVAVVQSDPETLAKAAQKALHDFLMAVWGSIEEALDKAVDGDLARRQLEDLIEFYWAATPLSPGQYKDTRDLCEQALSARKATRDFRPYEGVSRFKSSIDGWREHVLTRIPDRAARPNAQQMRLYKLRNGELLSGVDLLKRWGKSSKVERYKSVSHLAALPFAEGLGIEKADALQKALAQLFTQKGASSFVNDYSVFYPTEVRAAFREKGLIEEVLQEQQRLLTEYAGNRRPAPYYALLLADGDFMGKVIDEQITAEEHRRLSRALSAFARQVPGIVARYHGVTVYAGGDDILAYLPLHTALDCVQDLAKRFVQEMSSFTFNDQDGGQKFPTLSAGLVVAHHLEPLSDVLALARRAEKTAKAVPGKNALAIALNKRSGVERTVKGRLSTLVERLSTMTRWWLDGTLSKGTAYELEHLAREMEDVLPDEALRAEALRILKRKRESGGGQEVKKEVITKMEQWLRDQKISVGELAREMIIANEFARAREQAQGKEKEAA